jgi:hypothetical protein
VESGDSADYRSAERAVGIDRQSDCGCGFGSAGEADFAPALRLARNLGEDRFIGLEYYSDFGKIGDFLPLREESQQLFAVTDFKVKDVDVELGVGYGFTSGSDRLIVKAIIGYAFPVPGTSGSGAPPSSMNMGASARPSPSILLTK